MADKQPMQADGHESAKRLDPTEQPKPGSSGESAGGAYERPESTGEGRGDGARGGQSEQNYHGPGKLGDKAVGKEG